MISLFHRITRGAGNGIEFTRRNRITLTNKILISPQLKVLQFMLIVAGVYGTLFCLISGLDIPVYSSALIIAIFISTLYFFTVFLLPAFIKFQRLYFLIPEQAVKLKQRLHIAYTERYAVV